MTTAGLARPEKIPVKRSELRVRTRSKLLRKRRVGPCLSSGGPSGGDEDKCVLDRHYFEELLKRYSSLVETLEISLDRRLFQQILAAADTLEKELRSGRPHSFEKAFEEA